MDYYRKEFMYNIFEKVWNTKPMLFGKQDTYEVHEARIWAELFKGTLAQRWRAIEYFSTNHDGDLHWLWEKYGHELNTFIMEPITLAIKNPLYYEVSVCCIEIIHVLSSIKVQRLDFLMQRHMIALCSFLKHYEAQNKVDMRLRALYLRIMLNYITLHGPMFGKLIIAQVMNDFIILELIWNTLQKGPMESKEVALALLQCLLEDQESVEAILLNENSCESIKSIFEYLTRVDLRGSWAELLKYVTVIRLAKAKAHGPADNEISYTTPNQSYCKYGL